LAVAAFLFSGALPALATDTVGLVDESNGHWTLRAENGNSTAIGYGVPNDFPMMGDWDCDGTDTPGLYRQSDGFAYLRNSNSTGVADITFLFGIPGDVPLAGDFNGDGCDTLSIYRPGEARWYIINELGEDGGGLGAADYFFDYGVPGDAPFVGDWNGDGTDTPGLRRSSNGFVYVRDTNTTGVADVDYFYGIDGDRPFSGDWDGDGSDTVGLFRPSNSTFYIRNSNSTGVADSSYPMALAGSRPVAGSFGLTIGPPAPELSLEVVATDMDRPVFVAAPDGDDRLFVVEQTGDIELFVGGTKLASPFLKVPVTYSSEKGLLGLVFHPNYAANGRFYVNYTIGSMSRVSEFRVSADPNKADAASERVIFEFSQPHTNHNAGMLLFDGDGNLVIFTGDGGGSGDPLDRAEDPYDVLGKVLRLDVDNPSGSLEYSIPAGNPFVSGGGAPEVYVMGLRNPWRGDLDDGVLYIADVGQSTREEVTVIAGDQAGLNLGWNTWEGSFCFDPPCTVAGHVFPQVEYGRSSGCSVTGGFVYRGSDIPGLQGAFFYGDFCGGWIKSFRYENSIVGSHFDHTSTMGVVNRLSSFGYDGHGELYATSLQGVVHRIIPAP